MTEADLIDIHKRFTSALIGGDLKALDQLYASDYVLIRPNGQRLSKPEVLADIAVHAMRLSGMSSTSVQNKLYGSVGISISEAASTFVRDGP